MVSTMVILIFICHEESFVLKPGEPASLTDNTWLAAVYLARQVREWSLESCRNCCLLSPGTYFSSLKTPPFPGLLLQDKTISGA
jgi:hypothetical protein